MSEDVPAEGMLVPVSLTQRCSECGAYLSPMTRITGYTLPAGGDGRATGTRWYCALCHTGHSPLDVEPAAPLGSPELSLDRQRVVRALLDLEKGQRDVLLLGYFEGLSSSEIATELGLPLGTVKSRVAAALRSLRSVLAPPEERERSESDPESEAP